jgi:hypothetical protein
MRCQPKREYWRRRAGNHGRSRSFNDDEGDAAGERDGDSEKAAPEKLACHLDPVTGLSFSAGCVSFLGLRRHGEQFLAENQNLG